MSLPRARSIALFSSFLLFVCGTLFSVFLVFATPSDPQSAVLLGLSAFRLALILVLCLPLFPLTMFAIRAVRDRLWAARAWEVAFGRSRSAGITRIVSSLALAAGWVGVFLPAYRTGDYAGLFERLYPVFFLLLLAGILALLLGLADRIEAGRSRLSSALAAQRSTLRAAAFFGLVMAILWAGIAWSGLGIRTNEDYSYPTGVPLLASQGLVTLAAVGAMMWAGWFRWNVFRNGRIVFGLIWGVAAVVWAWTPLRQNYFMPGPYLPNGAFYPHSDAILFDLASQYALIGQGLHNGAFMDRALYMAVLFYLHLPAGQNYELLLAFQAALFAVLPALVYLLGKSLHSPAAGMMAAVFTLLRGVNAMALHTYIDTASPKMILTDFPTAIGLAAAAWFLVEWLRNPQEKWQYALWLGGALGFTIMLRTNAFLLLPFVFLFVLLRLGWAHWKKWTLACMLVTLAMVTSTLPWDLRNHSRGAPMFELYFFRIRDVLRFRYPALFSAESQSSFALVPRGADEIPGPIHAASIHLRRAGSQAVFISAEECHDNILCSVVSNYLHNFVTSVMVLPVSPVLDEARYAVKERAPYWQLTWTGGLTPAAGILLAVNLGIIALGLGSTWSRTRLAGFAPGMIFLAYHLSNGLARTSGGRYVVPADWIVVLYFAVGLVAALQWLMTLLGADAARPSGETETVTPVPAVTTRRRLQTGLFVLIALLAAGSTLPLTEAFYAPRYQPAGPETIAFLENRGALQQAGIEGASLDEFLRDPQAVFLTGRALYPRFYRGGRGDTDAPYQVRPYPRLLFTLIGPAGRSSILLPNEGFGKFPTGADAVVLGCNDKRAGVSALAVFLTRGDETRVYLRSPAVPLRCPAPEPVCDDNGNCR